MALKPLQTPMRALALAFGVAAGLAACFIEPGQPQAFRFTCDSDADCGDGETCAEGLCQIACTFATFEDDCPSDGGYTACFNGYCAHLCTPGEANGCPAPQSCQELSLDGIDLTGFGGGAQEIGVCGSLCDSGDPNACPAGEFCFEGFCAPLDGSETGTDSTDDGTDSTDSGDGTDSTDSGDGTDTTDSTDGGAS